MKEKVNYISLVTAGLSSFGVCGCGLVISKEQTARKTLWVN